MIIKIPEFRNHERILRLARRAAWSAAVLCLLIACLLLSVLLRSPGKFPDADTLNDPVALRQQYMLLMQHAWSSQTIMRAWHGSIILLSLGLMALNAALLFFILFRPESKWDETEEGSE